MTHPAYALAQELRDALAPACVRIEIAGSLRRGKENPKDIEIVCIPQIGVFEVKDMFEVVVERHTVNRLDEALAGLYADGRWCLDPTVKRNGPNYKRIIHPLPMGEGRGEGFIACDLFITEPKKWGVIFTIRTGPGDYSQRLVTLARRKGMFVQRGLLHNHAPVLDDEGQVMPCPAGDDCIRVIPTPEEADFFKALGVEYITPETRIAL